MKHVIEGVLKFRSEVFPGRQELFSELASGQSPQVLFITCADSRIDPSLVTQCGPGELFICRNAGNIVPPWGPTAESNTASIEYAVSVLGVSDVVVCGHTDCGAMKGALAPEGLEELPQVSGWLGHSRAAVATAKARHPGLEGEALLAAVTEENVLLQLQHLRTHPAITAAQARGELRLHGWVYDIGAGEIRAHDPQSGQFEAVHPLRHVA